MRRLCLALFLAVFGCEPAKEEQDLLETALRFRSLVERNELARAQTMVAEDARRWWGSREGEGSSWRVEQPGPWSGWDRHFRSKKEILDVVENPDRSVTVTLRETNDYFQMLDRGWVMNSVTYYFDEEGLIEGLLIRAEGERSPGRTEEFLAWARENEPDEIAALMPDGEIDPSGENPVRYRALLERWRATLDTTERPEVQQ